MGWLRRKAPDWEETHAQWLAEHPDKRDFAPPRVLPTQAQQEELRARMEAELVERRNKLDRAS